MLGEISRRIGDRLGLHFPEDRWRDLERGLTKAAHELGYEHVSQGLDRFLSVPLSPQDIEVLSSHLTVGETYFFREPKSFEALETRILPWIIQARQTQDRRLRIWSAGCSTGEEPYSLAIALSRVIPDMQNWHVTILATDINTQSLRRAEQGIYGVWSFRNVSEAIRECYFERTDDGGFRIRPAYKKMVSIAHLNLMDETYPSLLNNTNAMDVILCRNVLMYFDRASVQRVVLRLRQALVDGGWMMVSATESSLINGLPLTPVYFPDTVLYKKGPVVAPSIRAVSTHPMVKPRRPVSGRAPKTVTPTTLRKKPAPERRRSTPEEAPSSSATSLPIPAFPDPYDEALALYNQGRYAETIERLHGAAFSGGGGYDAMQLLARAHANQGNLPEARKISDTLVDAHKVNAHAHFLRAAILQEQGESAGATAALKRALYLEPEFVLAYIMLGNLTLQQKKIDTAAKHFDNALRLLKSSPEEAVVPESEGLTAGRLRQIIAATLTRIQGV